MCVCLWRGGDGVGKEGRRLIDIVFLCLVAVGGDWVHIPCLHAGLVYYSSRAQMICQTRLTILTVVLYCASVPLGCFAIVCLVIIAVIMVSVA